MEDVDDCDIVVGMLQSIAMRDYDEYIFHDFGMVIFDEVHVVPAPVFSRALLKLCTPYVLGLSATPERRDGLTRVIHWFVGPTFFEHALSGEDRVTVRVVDFRLNRALPMNTVRRGHHRVRDVGPQRDDSRPRRGPGLLGPTRSCCSAIGGPTART